MPLHPKERITCSHYIPPANLKQTIQDLYVLQSATHGYLGPETQAVLISQIHALTRSLQSLSRSASTLNTSVPPEIIAYIEEGRNPDIYTREFVELVQRGNVFLKGKSEAWGSFAEILGEEIQKAGIGKGEGLKETNEASNEDLKRESSVAVKEEVKQEEG